MHLTSSMKHKVPLVPVALFCMIIAASPAASEGQGIFSAIFSGGMNFSSLVPKRPIDAVTGASKWGAHGSVHAEVGIAGHFLETGLDYSDLHNSITYNDTDNNHDGTRLLTTHAIFLPVMYNFHFYDWRKVDSKLILGIGFFGAWFPGHEVKESGMLSDFQTEAWSAGPCLKISYFPLSIKEQYFPGVYLNLYRTISPYFSDDYYKGKADGILGMCDLGFSFKIKP